MANKAVKFRLYPNTEQQIFFAKTFGCCRLIWNLMLADKETYYSIHKKTLVTTPAQYKNDYPFLKEVDSLALANVQMNLQKSYLAFFKTKGMNRPKFKSKKTSRKSYTTNNQKGTILLSDGFIKLPKVGLIKVKQHKEISSEWNLKSATISQDTAGDYYVSILFEYEHNVDPVTPTTSVGLDYSSKELYVDNDGNTPAFDKCYRRAQKKLAKLQRQLCKKKKGSSNRDKAKLKVAKLHNKVANQRLDFLHKESRKIANSYDVVCVEDLNMKTMSSRLKLGKSTMDNGFGIFRLLLQYKLEEQGKFFVKIDKWYPSSQLCSHCGYQNPLIKDLSIREWDCHACGVHHDRDINAAINIREEGLRLLSERIDVAS